MDALTARLRREHPDVYPANGGLTFSIVPLQQQVVGDARRSILVLSAAVGFVLLIACANVANLLLSRGLGAAARDGRPRCNRRDESSPDPPAADGERRARAGRRLASACCWPSGASEWHPRARDRRACRVCTRSRSTRRCCCSRWSCRSQPA